MNGFPNIHYLELLNALQSPKVSPEEIQTIQEVMDSTYPKWQADMDTIYTAGLNRKEALVAMVHLFEDYRSQVMENIICKSKGGLLSKLRAKPRPLGRGCKRMVENQESVCCC